MLDNRVRDLMENHTFILAAYVLKAEANRQLWPACHK